jgi:hypothetical protein
MGVNISSQYSIFGLFCQYQALLQDAYRAPKLPLYCTHIHPLLRMNPIAFLLALLCSLSLGGCLKPDTSSSLPSKTITFDAAPGGGMKDPKHGSETWFAIGALSGTGGTSANGVSQAHLLADGTFVVVSRLNILPEGTGSFYESWIARRDGSDRRSMGKLVSTTNDARHEQRFESEVDLSKTHVQVLITKRKTGNPQDPGQVVAQGILKPVTR